MQDKKRNKHDDSDIIEAANNNNTTNEVPDGQAEENIGEKATEAPADDREKLLQELEASKDKYLRLVAEFENYKRRNAKERMELIQTAGKDIVVSLLPVLDDFDRAEKQINNSDDITHLKEGVMLVFNKLKTTLQSKGLKQMESKDSDFDVEKHEAIAEIEVPDQSLKGKVVDEVEKGYYLNDKLIRFAKVIVGK